MCPSFSINMEGKQTSYFRYFGEVTNSSLCSLRELLNGQNNAFSCGMKRDMKNGADIP